MCSLFLAIYSSFFLTLYFLLTFPLIFLFFFFSFLFMLSYMLSYLLSLNIRQLPISERALPAHFSHFVNQHYLQFKIPQRVKVQCSSEYSLREFRSGKIKLGSDHTLFTSFSSKNKNFYIGFFFLSCLTSF